MLTDADTADIHAVIISWQGQDASARHIAAEVAPCVTRLTVIYSNAAEAPETGAGTWIGVPNSAFFGAKFHRALDAHEGGILLLIHADTAFPDWPMLVDRCRAVFRRHSNLAIWSPDFTHSSYPTNRVKLGNGPEPDLISVAFPDGIVLGLRDDVVRRLQELDYSANNLGWGIVWAAVAYASRRGLLVCRETNLVVKHAESRGYDTSEASRQREQFLSQLPEEEQQRIEHLRTLIDKLDNPGWSSVWVRKLFSMVR